MHFVATWNTIILSSDSERKLVGLEQTCRCEESAQGAGTARRQYDARHHIQNVCCKAKTGACGRTKIAFHALVNASIFLSGRSKAERIAGF